jgi:hypothetical protein
LKGGNNTVVESGDIQDESGDTQDNMFLNSPHSEKPPKEEEPPMWFVDESPHSMDWLFEDE